MSRARYSLIPSAAVRDKSLTELQFRCLCMIGTYLGEGQSAFPSQSTLADDLSVTREAVNKAIKVLREKGYIRAQTRYRNDGGQTSNLYQVILDLPVTPCDPEITPGVIAEEHTPCERIGSHQEDTQSKIPKRTDSSDRLVDEAVELLWKITPDVSRKRSSRKELAAAIRALKGKHDPADLAYALKECIDDPQMVRDQHKYLPAIHRWIRDGRYESFLPPKPTLLPQGFQTVGPEFGSLDYHFSIWVKEGRWRGRADSFLLEPDDPDAKYPAALYAKYGLKAPEGAR